MKYLFITLLLCCSAFFAKAQVSSTMKTTQMGTPLKAKELLEPGALNYAIGQNKAPVILNIGSVEDIKGAIHIGPIKETANLEKLKNTLSSINKKAEVVIYCGCCPFGKCPNIRPAYTLLKEMGYSNVKVLNLYVNLRTNWTTAGYPLSDN